MGELWMKAGIVTVVLLAVYTGAMTKCGRKLRPNILLLIPTVVLGWTLYYHGYIYVFGFRPGTPVTPGIFADSALRAVFSTARMFLGEDDSAVIATGGDFFNKPAFLIPFWACHVSALLVSVMTVISVFGKKLVALLRKFFSFRKARYIIYGVNQKSLCFAGNILKKEKQSRNKKSFVVFIDENADEAQRRQLHKIGAVLQGDSIFIGSQFNIKALKRAGMKRLSFHRNTYIVAFADSEMLNFSIVNGILQNAPRTPEKCRVYGIYIYSESQDIIKALERKNVALSEPFNIVSFSQEDLSARQLFNAHPLYKRLEFDGLGLPVTSPGQDKATLTVIILGFGSTGKHILQKAILSGQFLGCAFKAYVFDHRIKDIAGEYINDYPGLFPEYPDLPTDKKIIDAAIEFCHDDTGSEGFFATLRNIIKSRRVDHIITCLGDDSQNFRVISGVRRLVISCGMTASGPNAKDFPVLSAHIADMKFRHFKSETADCLGRIHFFGDYDEIFTKEIIINEEMDILAKAVNAFYDHTNLDSDNAWRSLTTHLKNSNRAAAAFIKAHLYILGLELMTKKEQMKLGRRALSPEEYRSIFFEKDGKEKPITEHMGQAEHLRWIGFHLAHGWTTKPVADVTGYKSRKDTDLKKQVCLVTWEKLKELGDKILNWEEAMSLSEADLADMRKKCDFQGIDKEAVTEIGHMIARYNIDKSIRNDRLKEYCIVRRAELE